MLGFGSFEGITGSGVAALGVMPLGVATCTGSLGVGGGRDTLPIKQHSHDVNVHHTYVLIYNEEMEMRCLTGQHT